MKVYKIWRTYSSVHSGHYCSCICTEACEASYRKLKLQNWRKRKLDHSIVVAAVSQWCLCQGSRWTFLGTFYDGFVVRCVKL